MNEKKSFVSMGPMDVDLEGAAPLLTVPVTLRFPAKNPLPSASTVNCCLNEFPLRDFSATPADKAPQTSDKLARNPGEDTQGESCCNPEQILPTHVRG